MRKFLTSVVAAALLLTVLAPVARADDKPNLKVRFLLQSQAVVNENGNPAGDAWGSDFFLRRARIILAGNVNKWIHFFVETDNPKMGMNGDWTPKTFIQDAFVDFRFYKEFKLSAGMILLPFTHHNRQSAASLNTLDYHNLFSGKFVRDFVWRDAGVEARGIVADMLDYRIGVFNGLRGEKTSEYVKDSRTVIPKDAGYVTLNPDDMPRITGRVALNFFDVEDAFFYGGTYLGGKKVLAVGAGFDFQPGGALNDQGEAKMYSAFSGDIYLDMPLSDKMELTGQAAFVYFDRGSQEVVDELGTHLYNPSASTGMGAYGDLGFRYDFIQPVIGAEWFDADNDAGDTAVMRAGINWWIKGHNANLKLEFARVQKGANDFSDGTSQFTLQSQFLF